jgi:hypothetical protein
MLKRYENKPLSRVGPELNKVAVARECQFRREIFRNNPRCEELSDEADRNGPLALPTVRGGAGNDSISSYGGSAYGGHRR